MNTLEIHCHWKTEKKLLLTFTYLVTSEYTLIY